MQLILFIATKHIPCTNRISFSLKTSRRGYAVCGRGRGWLQLSLGLIWKTPSFSGRQHSKHRVALNLVADLVRCVLTKQKKKSNLSQLPWMKNREKHYTYLSGGLKRLEKTSQAPSTSITSPAPTEYEMHYLANYTALSMLLFLVGITWYPPDPHTSHLTDQAKDGPVLHGR